MKIRTILFTAILLASFMPFMSYAQQTLGGGAIYNFQTRSVGLDIRTEYVLQQFDVLEGIVVSPQLSYYPWLNNVHEIYLGGSLHLGLYSYNKWVAYGLTNISYNAWFNYKESGAQNAKFSNLGFELGGGITNSNCTRPFFEYRYNFKWREGNIRAGIVYTFHCQNRGMVPCPKIPKAPIFDN